MTLPIDSERLLLRRFTQDDGPDMLEFTSQPSVAKATSENIESTEEGIRKYIDLQNSFRPFEKDKVFDLAIELKGAGKVIGLLTLVCQEHEQGAIGWALHEAYRGQGYATEAAAALMNYGFETLGLHRIHAETSSANVDSWRVMERLGMRPEARLREAVQEDGAWADTLIYGILADEWRGGRAGDE